MQATRFMVRPAILTTSWDDGHPLDLRVAELLAKYGLTGTFYVPLQSERGVMSQGELRELSRTFEVGAHTVHHVRLTTVPMDLARTEIAASKVRIEDTTDRQCTMFCFPGGKFRRAHLSLVRENGFRGARTVEMLSTAYPGHRDGIAVMPTTVQACPPRPLTYLKNCLKRLAVRNLWNYARYSPSSDWAVVARSLLALTVRRGGVFHLWGHSWEIAAHDQWRQLEEVLKCMGSLRGQVRCLSNAEVCASVG